MKRPPPRDSPWSIGNLCHDTRPPPWRDSRVDPCPDCSRFRTTKNQDEAHWLSQRACPAPVHIVAWSQTASRKRNTGPARNAVLNVGASFQIRTSNRNPRERSPSPIRYFWLPGLSRKNGIPIFSEVFGDRPWFVTDPKFLNLPDRTALSSMLYACKSLCNRPSPSAFNRDHPLAPTMQCYSCSSALCSSRDIVESTIKQEAIMEIALIPGLFVGIFALGAALILWFPYDAWSTLAEIGEGEAEINRGQGLLRTKGWATGLSIDLVRSPIRPLPDDYHQGRAAHE